MSNSNIYTAMTPISAVGVPLTASIYNVPPPVTTLSAKPPFRPKVTPFGTALMEAVNQATDSSVWTTEEIRFRILSGNDAINIFGKLRPHMKLRPKKWAEMLLRTCPSPTNAYSKTAQYYYHQAVSAGLMYALPLVYGSRRTRFRLSASGVVLLDYYADRWPDFMPYVKAYLPQKAREEIQVDSCDFIMGIEPEWLKKEKAKAEEAKEKWTKAKLASEQALMQEYMRRNMLAAQQNPVWTSTSTATTSAIGSLLGSQTSAANWPYHNVGNQTTAVGQSTWSAVQAAAKRLAGK